MPAGEHGADDIRGVGCIAGRVECRARGEQQKDAAAEPESLDQSRDCKRRTARRLRRGIGDDHRLRRAFNWFLGHANTLRIESSYGFRSTPRSVMIALISRAGVTSNAGCRTPIPSGAIETPFIDVTSAALRSSIGIDAPFGQFTSIVDSGAAM